LLKEVAGGDTMWYHYDAAGNILAMTPGDDTYYYYYYYEKNAGRYYRAD
jgi:hypothetical protein